jgi:hypothetical protein
MKPTLQQQSASNIQRHNSTLGNNNPGMMMMQAPNQMIMQQKQPFMNMNQNMMQPVYYVAGPQPQPLQVPPQIPMFTSPGQYNLTMPPMMTTTASMPPQSGPIPYVQYPFSNQNITTPNQPIYYYQMPSASIVPRTTPLFIPNLNTNRSFTNFKNLSQPPPPPPHPSSIPIDSKEYEPPKMMPLALPPPPPPLPPSLPTQLSTLLPLRPPSDLLTDRQSYNTTPVQIYKLQKPVIVVDSLKHPSDKYKDLIYKPKFLTSRNLDPPTEELVPKWNEYDDELPPLPTFAARNASKINIDINLRYPSLSSSNRSLESLKLTSRNPTLVNDLKLPYNRPESKEPTLVGDLKLPIEKVRKIL